MSQFRIPLASAFVAKDANTFSVGAYGTPKGRQRHVVCSTGSAGPRGKSPGRVVLVQLKRTFEGRHHSLQLAWETKRASQVLLDCRPRHDTALRNQHSYVGAAVHDHNVLVQILNRCNNGVGHSSRLENRTDSVIDSRCLFGHDSFSSYTPAHKLLVSSISTRMSSPSTLIGNILRHALCGFTPDPLQTSNSQ